MVGVMNGPFVHFVVIKDIPAGGELLGWPLSSLLLEAEG